MTHLLATSRFVAFSMGIFFAASIVSFLHSEELKSARITEVVKDVTLLSGSGTSRAASVGDLVSGQTSLKTGTDSRVELEFPDKTLLRIGANSVFSVAGASRDISLREGSALIQTAGDNGGVNVRSGTVTAAISGSLGLFAVSDPKDKTGRRNGEKIVKFISVHGTMHLEFGGDEYDLNPFELIFFRVDAKGQVVGQPIIQSVDGRLLAKSSKLLNGFSHSDRIDLTAILNQLKNQGDEKEKNIWVKVTTGVEDNIVGLPRRNTTGLSSLIPASPPPEVGVTE